MLSCLVFLWLRVFGKGTRLARRINTILWHVCCRQACSDGLPAGMLHDEHTVLILFPWLDGMAFRRFAFLSLPR